MLGSRYRLSKPTHAVYAEDGLKGFVLLPEGAMLTVDSIESSGRLLKIRWNNVLLLMFCQDLIERGIEVEAPPPKPARAASQRL